MKLWGHSLITKKQMLKRGETFYRYGEAAGVFRCGPVIGIHKCRWTGGRAMWRSQSMAEKRQWYDYEDQFKDAGFTVRRRRGPRELIDSYDDWPKNRYPTTWKDSTKKRRQWGGDVQLIYCG